MTDFARRIVSGKKARTVDEEIGTDLDLARISDQVIIMGWPATGIEALYRNRRKDVLRWLEHHHGRDWRIFNFVPRFENVYPAEDFYGQVSRTPWPDHHPPPLSLIALCVHEMNTYLRADPKRVAVIHCKAGKGRSGTMTCCYLLSLPKLPRPPQLVKRGSRPGDDSPSSSATDLVSTTSTDDSASTEPSDNEADEPKRRSTGGVAKDALSLKTISRGRRRAEKLVAGLQGAGGNIAVEGGDDAEPGPSDHVDLDAAPDAAQTSKRDVVKQAVGLGPADGKTANAEMLDMADQLASVFDLHSSTRMKPGSGAKGVSIPSQRRFVGYWAQMLCGDDPRPTTGPRRQIVITSITCRMTSERLDLPKPLGGKKLNAVVSTYRTDYIELIERRERALREKPAVAESWSDDDWPDRADLFVQVGSFVQSHNDGLVRELVPATTTEAGGLVVDADREVQIKILVGKTGATHSILPDVAALGYIWLVPSFESKPVDQTRTFVARPDNKDIDFCKPQGNIEAIEIVWRWL